MTKKLLFTLLSVFLSVMTVVGQVTHSVNVSQPGGLSAAIGTNLKTVTDLTLMGIINATDFETIKQMTALQNLNMEKVSVVDNTIPAYAFQNRVLNSLMLPEGVETIGDNAFRGSRISTGLVLPSSLKTIQVWAFDGSSTKVDFSKTKKSLISLHPRAFNNYTGSSVLDFSDYPNTLTFEYVNVNGVFSGYAGHVIYPKSMDNVPNFTFYDFRGSVDLPQGLKTLSDYSFNNAQMKELILPEGLETIGGAAFRGSKIESGLILPSTLKTIQVWAFDGSSTKVDFSKTKKSLISLHPRAFNNYIGSSVLDFSDYPNTLTIEYVNVNGVFSGYAGHVIYPKSMDNVPNFTFYDFRGSVDLPQGLKTIGVSAFQQSSIKSIEIPSSVIKIENNAFLNASQLEKIISNNPTPPALGNNVFGGVNKETTVLEVPKQSVNLYGTADQWKDFLNVSSVTPTLPIKVDLVYKINTHPWSPVGDPNYPDIIVPYHGVRIGEYYWMNTNFNHVEPRRTVYVQETVLSGAENEVPMSQKILNRYFEQMQTDSSGFQIDIDQFSKDFGVYYQYDTWSYYMRDLSIMYENGTQSTGWSIPHIADYRQLIAMSPFRKSNTTFELGVHDAMTALAATPSTNVMSGTKYIDSRGGDWSYWFDFGAEGGNPYGFSLMPSGMRLQSDQSWGTEINNQKISKDGVKGDIIQLFHRAILPAKDGVISFHETISTHQVGHHDGWFCIDGSLQYQSGQDFHWLPVRWCRLLTDEELGYKLYIKIDNIDHDSKEWKSFADEGYEIDLLNFMRNNNISTDQTSIIKQNIKAAAPSGYIELPHGYIRGFYVQHILDKPNTTITVSDVMKYAYNVKDFVLEYTQGYQRVPGSSTPTALKQDACQSSTRSISTDDVVIPFRTSSEVRIYPNPVQDVLNVSGEGVEKISLYDLSGRQLQSVSNASSIQMSGLTAGTYIVRVQTASGESVHKVMKK